MDIAIKFNNVSKVYCKDIEKARRQAVRDIFFKRNSISRENDVFGIKDLSFEVKEKSPFLILGPAKSGKTTIARLICGLSQPTSGVVNVTGSVMLVGYKNVSATPFMTVRNYLKLYCMCHNANAGELENLCATILQRTGFDKFAGEVISRFPPENMKRLNYYASLMISSDIYLFDEALRNDASDFGMLCKERIEEIFSSCTAIVLSKEPPRLPVNAGGRIVLAEENLSCCYDSESGVISHYSEKKKISRNSPGFHSLPEMMSIADSKIKDISLTDKNGKKLLPISSDGQTIIVRMQDFFINVAFKVSLTDVAISAGIDFYTDGILAFGSRQPIVPLNVSGDYIAQVLIPANLLETRFYIVNVSVSIVHKDKKQALKIREALKFHVSEPPANINSNTVPAMNPGIIRPLLKWSLLPDQNKS